MARRLLTIVLALCTIQVSAAEASDELSRHIETSATNIYFHTANPDLLRELRSQRLEALRQATPENIRRSMEQGKVEPFCDRLREQEQRLASRSKGRAARLARWQGALAFLSNTHSAEEAFKRAAAYEPGGLVNWWVLGDLALLASDAPEATRAHEQLAHLAVTVDEGSSTPTAVKRQLVVSYRRMADMMLIAGRDQEALAAYRRSIAIVERLQHDDPDDAELDWELARANERLRYALAAIRSKSPDDRDRTRTP
jgi:hypothetical protein